MTWVSHLSLKAFVAGSQAGTLKSNQQDLLEALTISIDIAWRHRWGPFISWRKENFFLKLCNQGVLLEWRSHYKAKLQFFENAKFILADKPHTLTRCQIRFTFCVCGAGEQPVAGMFPSFAAPSLPSDRSWLKWAAPCNSWQHWWLSEQLTAAALFSGDQRCPTPQQMFIWLA